MHGGVSVESEPAVVVPPLERLAEDRVGHVHRNHLLHRRLVAHHVGMELQNADGEVITPQKVSYVEARVVTLHKDLGQHLL